MSAGCSKGCPNVIAFLVGVTLLAPTSWSSFNKTGTAGLVCRRRACP